MPENTDLPPLCRLERDWSARISFPSALIALGKCGWVARGSWVVLPNKPLSTWLIARTTTPTGHLHQFVRRSCLPQATRPACPAALSTCPTTVLLLSSPTELRPGEVWSVTAAWPGQASACSILGLLQLASKHDHIDGSVQFNCH